MRTEVIPQKTREVWEKYAKVISEAEAKVEKAKADLATASEDLVKKSKADDQVLKKLAAEVKEIEQKKAAMESCPRRHERPWPGTASCRRKPAPRTQKSELGGRPARPDGGTQSVSKGGSGRLRQHPSGRRAGGFNEGALASGGLARVSWTTFMSSVKFYKSWGCVVIDCSDDSFVCFCQRCGCFTSGARLDTLTKTHIIFADPRKSEN
ncbi:unnamed protein product [Prorocentrum cordatum]|uniref:Uncharacterized protein n=1 Tax=Prorocentrum cordatum TaxID=2364126 RepID=A0ABN9U7T4_9DINO|nr:unnamed protein product [Polarella glacialis]